MTRKDYILIARVLADLVDAEPHKKHSVTILARRFALAFETDNPSFDYDRFMSACHIA